MITTRRTKYTGNENNLYALRDVKSDLINQETVEYAIEFYSELNLLIGKYSEDVMTGILPHIICVLNRLDACIKVNQDLTNIIRDNNIEIKNLQCNMLKEKSLRYEIYDSSLSNEEAYTKEIFNLNEKNLKLLDTNKKLESDILIINQELEGQKHLENTLQEEIKKMKMKLNSLKCSIELNDKLTKQDVVEVNSGILTMDLENQFNTPSFQKDTELHTDNRNKKKEKVNPIISCNKVGQDKRNILVLADSHGRNLREKLASYLNTDNYDITFHVKPGAKLRDVMSLDCLNALTKHVVEGDIVIVFGGVNDVGKYSPHQLSLIN